jgi:hypothetical protein
LERNKIRRVSGEGNGRDGWPELLILVKLANPSLD